MLINVSVVIRFRPSYVATKRTEDRTIVTLPKPAPVLTARDGSPIPAGLYGRVAL